MTVQFRGYVPPINADFLPNQQCANLVQANAGVSNSIMSNAQGSTLSFSGPSPSSTPAGCGGSLNCSA